ncbi:uncharacterized protein CCR75_001182 [Bremia lactucae]|uniref:Uncharacterized protein n=1 Tax=Bremia lactucae TaxID=4779 RepID=A0A976ILY7_BRELC|nr:hypothetical protein CCR75_001182 [Bremia lactucae]
MAPKHGVHHDIIPWESDRISSDSPSSQDVLINWLTTPANATRWRHEKRKRLLHEILQLLQTNGMTHRTVQDVSGKISSIENSFTTATAFLLQTGELEAFNQGVAAQEIVETVRTLCPQYRELQRLFGVKKGKKKLPKDGLSASNGAASDSMETRTESSLDTKDGSRAKDIETPSLEETTFAVETGVEASNSEQKKPTSADSVASCAAEKHHLASMKQRIHNNNGHGDNNGGARYSDERKTSHILDTEKDTNGNEKDVRRLDVADKKERDDGDEKMKVLRRFGVQTGVRSPFKTKWQHQIEFSKSSDDKEISDEDGRNDGDSDEDDIVHNEEWIPLAQRHKLHTTNVVKVDNPRHKDDDNADDKEDDSDQLDANDKNVRNSEENEETEDEELETVALKRGIKSAADSNEESSTSEHDKDDLEEEVPPTQLTTRSDLNEEPIKDQSKQEKDVIERSKNEIDCRTFQKHSMASNELYRAKATKRLRTERVHNDRLKDLERVAFIKRAKQEQDQRNTLFELERATLECELEAKQVQLTMERALARKRLLSAGIEPAEVDRVLPL